MADEQKVAERLARLPEILARAERLPDVVSDEDIARCLGVKPENVRRYRHRGRRPLPPPDFYVTVNRRRRGMTRRETFLAWLDGWNPAGGRPPRRETATA